MDADGRQHRMTQQELSRKIGVRNVSLSYIENDHRNMSLDLLQKIASQTGVTVGFLLKETPYPYRAGGATGTRAGLLFGGGSQRGATN